MKKYYIKTIYEFLKWQVYSLCRNVQDLDQGMCKCSQYEVQRKCAMYRDENTEL